MPHNACTYSNNLSTFRFAMQSKQLLEVCCFPNQASWNTRAADPLQEIQRSNRASTWAQNHLNHRGCTGQSDRGSDTATSEKWRAHTTSRHVLCSVTNALHKRNDCPAMPGSWCGLAWCVFVFLFLCLYFSCLWFPRWHMALTSHFSDGHLFQPLVAGIITPRANGMFAKSAHACSASDLPSADRFNWWLMNCKQDLLPHGI